mmetsp:Transcript_76894/g.178342  ORF Transcript_76894/g.178342 Transcript_76894/m.178342 type:complete len:297 (-) Transcript_76894:610-1500(-)
MICLQALRYGRNGYPLELRQVLPVFQTPEQPASELVTPLRTAAGASGTGVVDSSWNAVGTVGPVEPLVPQRLLRCPTRLDVLVDQPIDQINGRTGHAPPDLPREVRWLTAADGINVLTKGQVTREHDVEHDASAPEIHCAQKSSLRATPLLYQFIPVLLKHFRSHVGDATLHLRIITRGLGVAASLSGPHKGSYSEVCKLQGQTVGVLRLEEEVLGLDVSVHYTHGMAVCQGIEHLLCEGPCHLLGQVPFLGYAAEEITTLAKFHQQTQRIAVLHRLIESYDVRVVKPAEHGYLAA